MDSDSSVGPLLGLACRFLPHDQWFTTRLDPEWKVRQAKSWLLSKCLPYAAPPSPPLRQAARKPQRPPSPITFAPDPRHRPISPITFAMPKQQPTQAGSSGEDNESRTAVADSDLTDSDKSGVAVIPMVVPQQPRRRPPVSSTVVGAGPKGDLYSQFTLIRFSTGQLLEDDLPLSFYDLQTDELLEIHRLGVVVTLPRAYPKRYLDAYWEGWVRVLRIRPLEDEEEDAWSLYKIKQNETRPVEWKDRWLVVREGIIYLCRDEAKLIRKLSLSDLLALTNASALPAAVAPSATTRILLARFAPSLASGAGSASGSYGPTRASSPLLANNIALQNASLSSYIITTHFNDPSEASDGSSSALSSPIFAHSRDSSDGSPRRNVPHKSKSRTKLKRKKKREKENPEYLALDLKDDSAYVSLLRVLHRYALPASTFVAALPVSSSMHPSLSSFSPPNSPVDEDEGDAPPLRHPPSLAHLRLHSRTAASSSLGALPFPEWRTAVLSRARRAGVGRVNQAIDWVMWNDEDEENGEGEKDVMDVLLRSGSMSMRSGISNGAGKGKKKSKGKGKERAKRQPTDGYASDLSGEGDDEVGDDEGTAVVESGDSDSDESDFTRGRRRRGGGTRSETEWVAWMGDLRRQARVAEDTRVRILAEREARRRAEDAREAELGMPSVGIIDAEVTVARVGTGVDDRHRRRAMEPSAVVTSLSGVNPPPPAHLHLQHHPNNHRHSTLYAPYPHIHPHTLSSPSSNESLGGGSNDAEALGDGVGPPHYGLHTRQHSHTLLHSVSMHEVVASTSGDGLRRPSMPVLGWGSGHGNGHRPRSRPSSLERGDNTNSGVPASPPRTGITEVRRTGSVGPTAGRTLLRKKDKEREKESERESDRRREKEAAKEREREMRRPRLSLSTASSARTLIPIHSPPGTPHEDHVAPLPEPAKKKKRGLVRGVSIRADKLVKSLDSALDFVDGR
ncbi:hypothetical protein FB45DRAFT_921829 [Roridomyces roridus]|uniref:Uncharacterized protein n=1 Tax=Roridomyces roridus TaxID=1738132 RepID=A0AAD7BND7_9AGAR|nr:hypothetical protein FB45DRAFT_921829 [Roridomyces roridus]